MYIICHVRGHGRDIGKSYAHRITTTRPASADRTARRQFQAGLRGDVWTLIDGYLESPFPTACLLSLKCGIKILPVGSLD